MKLKIFFFFLFSIIINFVFAQSTTIENDRPSYSNTTYTTPHKWLQTEVGFSREVIKYEKPYKEVRLQVPTLLIKYGIAKKVEIRLLTEFEFYKLKLAAGVSRANYLNNFQIGSKFNFMQQRLIIPKISLMAHLIINNFKQKNIPIDTVLGFNCKLLFQNKITNGFVLNYSAGLEWEHLAYKDPEINFSLTPSFHISDDWNLYIEIFGETIEKYTPVFNIGSGLSYKVNSNFKIDITAGGTINKSKAYKYAPNLFYGFGLSYRLPTKN
jgi:Putative MetA-pathway of phenol degradation